MGGTVQVFSKVGKGTDFVINLKTKCKVTKVQNDGQPNTPKFRVLESDVDQIKSHLCFDEKIDSLVDFEAMKIIKKESQSRFERCISALDQLSQRHDALSP